jgi:hypothetical protein
MARTTKSPALEGVQEQFALPDERFPEVHKVLLEASLNVTVPVAPVVTLAVKVTAVPNAGVVDDAISVVVVLAVFIVKVAAFDARKATAVVFELVFEIVTL